ncbi:DNA polymerase III subunit delta [Catenovulum maritimum]|uniref:DNA polymerase III subunit delta n=1 Tax=Catenovulum maritimum TaxID=1513271 RepID=A0A0J8GY72_9ALTE|nr:DNA polymerase III subunit delta [Catenovulum maritimum]KMT66184.1 hypothetical protein XM47_05305 [Catenovulum maritimum]
MRVYANQLQRQLKQPLPKILMVFGEEPFQQQQILDQLRAHCLETGFDERVRFTADDKFNWQLVLDEAQALSLFATRKLIEVEMPNAKPGKEGAAFFKTWLELTDNENILLLWGGKLEAAQTKTKWFKSLDADSWFFPIYEISRQQMPEWVSQQVQTHQLQLTPDAQALLCDLFEGNLLGAAQEISRLSLVYPHSQIDIEKIREAVSDNSRFTVFQLGEDLLLNNNRNKIVQILQRLAGEELEPVIVSWLLHREAENLAQLKVAQQNRQFDAECKKLRIWDNRKAGYNAALNRLSIEQINSILQAIELFDREYKTTGLTFAYTRLAHICALFSGDPSLFSFNQAMLVSDYLD